MTAGTFVLCKIRMSAVLLEIQLLTFQLVYRRLELKHQACVKQLNYTHDSAKKEQSFR
jgi:hypothetical protein